MKKINGGGSFGSKFNMSFFKKTLRWGPQNQGRFRLYQRSCSSRKVAATGQTMARTLSSGLVIVFLNGNLKEMYYVHSNQNVTHVLYKCTS
jgi:hypothetical protein